MVQWFKIERIPGVLASTYAKATCMAIESYYHQIAAKIVAHLKSGIILDLGTGPGYLPIAIVRKSSQIRVTGIDLSRKLIKMARSNASAAGLEDRLNFQAGNAGKLNFDNSSFDMVISTGMLHSIKEPAKVLQEIYRVLKKGKEAWIFDPAKVTSAVDREKWKASLNLRERFFLWLFELLGLHEPIRVYTRKEALEMIAKTDFKHFWIDAQGDEIKIKLKKD
jgi:ubiquinone/menaquinone biosynthesis C-methylase UbiE